MVENYCGKKCEECTYKVKLECQGCDSVGAGQIGGEKCKIATCCKDKGHKACATCGHAPGCGTLRDRGNIPSYWLKEREEKAEQREINLKRAPFLGKWIGILFWLIVPGVLAGIMMMEGVATLLPVVGTVGEVLNILVTVSYGFILFRLSALNEHYRTSGICCLIAAAVNAFLVFVLSDSVAGLSLLFLIPAAVVAIYGEYNEYKGHEEVLREIDFGLSGSWDSLWKWYRGVYIALIGGIVLMVLLPLLGALVMLGAAIGEVVVEIVKLVYLYRTAKVCQDYR